MGGGCFDGLFGRGLGCGLGFGFGGCGGDRDDCCGGRRNRCFDRCRCRRDCDFDC
jgi:hypothetical protein